MRLLRLGKIEAGDIVVLISDWQMTGTSPDGSAVSDSGRTYDIVRRQPDDTWRVVVDNPWGTVVAPR
jgi:ketosteroid isomerase-like protein